eukprot:822384_1
MGSTPPLVTAIRTLTDTCQQCARHLEHDRTKCPQDECLLDVHLNFGGQDTTLSLAVIFRKVKTVAKLSNVNASFILRLKLTDFVNVTPGFSTIQYSLVDYPSLDYKLELAV